MNNLIVFGSDGLIFDLKPKESTFDNILTLLGRAKESGEMQKRYLQGKAHGPSLLLEKIHLFGGVSLKRLLQASEEYIKKKLRPDFPDLLNSLKKKGYLIAIITSNPSLPYLLLKSKYPIDAVFATELEVKSEICTGRCIPLKFSQDFEAQYKKEHLELSEFWTLQPNRYGLTQKLAQYIKEKSIDTNHSWIVGNKVTKIPQAQLIPHIITFHNSDPELLQKATISIKEGEPLNRILEYV